MWCVTTENIDERTRRSVLLRDGVRVSFGSVIDGWQVDQDVRSCMIEDLSTQPFPAYCWETPPLSQSSLEQPFEYVIVAQAGLQRFAADPEPFLGYFKASAAADDILTFPNLGGDATLVVPRPRVDHRAYAHLGVFMREAPEAQRHSLFRAVGLAMRGRLSSNNTWLSTAGLGVSWLHVRLDSRPKYYNFLPYCRSS